MTESEIIIALADRLRTEFSNESTGHDWFHIERVWKNTRFICQKEGGNVFLAELGALLHDIADHKFVENADAVATSRIQAMLTELGVSPDLIHQVTEIVKNSSFKGGIQNTMKIREGLMVQDADRLDAIGAIGIARTFAFGGKFGNLIYHPDIAPTAFKSAEEYRTNRTHTINHFYEKLLLLKDQMNTATGKQMAEERHAFMLTYLDQFYNEWNAIPSNQNV